MRQLVSAIFADADTDGDGQVSLEEFAAFIKRNGVQVPFARHHPTAPPLPDFAARCNPPPQPGVGLVVSVVVVVVICFRL